MPSDSQPASGATIPQFPRVEEEIGENPARFLDHDLLGSQGCGNLIRARIRGLDSLEAVRAWKAVERALDRDTRDKVIEMLDVREQQLQESGDRPDRLPHGPRRPPEWFDSESAIQEEGEETARERLGKLRSSTEGESA